MVQSISTGSVTSIIVCLFRVLLTYRYELSSILGHHHCHRKYTLIVNLFEPQVNITPGRHL